MRSKLPNFFVVGTGKAGTTSLYLTLKAHPQIFMSPVKEPSFFASEIRIENLSLEFKRHAMKQSGELNRYLISDWGEYVKLFDGAGDVVAIGEATPSYLWSAAAAANIHARFPQAKIVMILRDPAERAYSYYLHLAAEGLTRCSLREHLTQCERAEKGAIGIWHPFLEVGLYYEQVKRYLDLFPRGHVRVFWYEERWELADLLRFLGVDPSWQPDSPARSLPRRTPRMVSVRYLLKRLDLLEPLRRIIPRRLRPLAFNASAPPPMAAQDRRWLVDYYRDDVRQLASLMDRDLATWLR